MDSKVEAKIKEIERAGCDCDLLYGYTCSIHIRQFAELMSSMMDYKEDSKGPIEQDYPLTKALMNMQAQWRKLEENPMPQRDDFRRIMVHVANFAMIAFQISLRNQRGGSIGS